MLDCLGNPERSKLAIVSTYRAWHGKSIQGDFLGGDLTVDIDRWVRNELGTI